MHKTKFNIILLALFLFFIFPAKSIRAQQILWQENWEDRAVGQTVGGGVSQTEYNNYGGGIVDNPVFGDSTRTLELFLKEGLRDTIFPTKRTTPQNGITYLRWYAKWSDGYIWNSAITKHMYLLNWDSNAVLQWGARLHMKRKDGQLSVAKPVFQLYCG